jgi:hypothetical protein
MYYSKHGRGGVEVNPALGIEVKRSRAETYFPERAMDKEFLA